MMKRVMLLLLVSFITLAACGQAGAGTPTAAPAGQPATVPVTTKAPPASGVSGTGGNGTAAQVAVQGKAIYLQQCQVCHGAQGEGVVGPALIGPKANPAKFGPTAANWFTFIRTNMPQTAPGSLSVDDYVAVTSYLLLQNGLVTPEQQVSEQAFREIKTAR